MGSISFAVGYNCLMRKQYQFAVRVNTENAIGTKLVTGAQRRDLQAGNKSGDRRGIRDGVEMLSVAATDRERPKSQSNIL